MFEQIISPEIGDGISFKNKTHVLVGDCITVMQTLPEKYFRCCITSPPYFQLRDYGIDGQIGREETTDLYIEKMVQVFRGVHRVLRDDGTLWINIGDKYHNGNRMMIPARLFLALQADGWIIRDEIVWSKTQYFPNNSKTKTTNSHEMLYMLAKQDDYFYDFNAIQIPCKYPGRVVRRNSVNKYNDQGTYRNSNDRTITGQFKRKNSVWEIAPSQSKEAHVAPFPRKLVEPCILAGSQVDDWILDPFGGSGTTAVVANGLGRNSVMIELNPSYASLISEKVV